MSVDPTTGMVQQGYTAVSREELEEFVRGYRAAGGALSEVYDERMNIDAFEDKGVGPWPEGVMAFTSRQTGNSYILDTSRGQL